VARASTGGSTRASTIATNGENGCSAGPKPPKNTTVDTPAEMIIEPKPTGLTA